MRGEVENAEVVELGALDGGLGRVLAELHLTGRRPERLGDRAQLVGALGQGRKGIAQAAAVGARATEILSIGKARLAGAAQPIAGRRRRRGLSEDRVADAEKALGRDRPDVARRLEAR